MIMRCLLYSEFKNVCNQRIILNKCKDSNNNLLINFKQQFSTSKATKSIPPLFWIFFKPVTKLSAILVGRGFRKWWTSLPQSKKGIFFDHLKRNKYRYLLIGSGTTFTSSFYYFSHIQETPITNRKRFILFSSSQLIEIENLEKDQVYLFYYHKYVIYFIFKYFFKLFIDYKKNVLDLYSPHANRALRVANRLFVANKELPQVAAINWKLTVIDAEISNAAAFPSGDLIVFTGLLDFVKNDDELAIILAHEMSHAILQHAAEEISHSRLIDICSIGLAGLVWAFLPSDLTAILTQYLADKFLKFVFELPYSRYLEKEADEVGLTLAARVSFILFLLFIYCKKLVFA
jgi:Zn-dependent protease with chaperone function